MSTHATGPATDASLVALPRRVLVSSEVLCQHVEGRAVLLDLAVERYYSLDDVGTRVWDLLSGDGDVEAAVTQLLATYDVEEDRLRHDLAELLERLCAAGLMSRQD